jgi:hypothetical protein
MLGDVTSPAVADPYEAGQRVGPSSSGVILGKWLQQAKGARGLFLAESGDELLKALLRCHMTMIARHAGRPGLGTALTRACR